MGITDIWNPFRGLSFHLQYLCPKSDKFALKAARDIAEGETLLCPLILVNAVLKEIWHRNKETPEHRDDKSWYWDDEIGCAVFYGYQPDYFYFTNAMRRENFDV